MSALLLLNDAVVSAPAGLQALWNSILTGWIGPIYLAMIAIFSLKFIKDMQWMRFASFIGIAALVGVTVFAGATFFGSTGKLTNAAKTQANSINAVQLHQIH